MDWWMGFIERFGLPAACMVAFGFYIRSLVNDMRKDKLSCEQERIKTQENMTAAHEKYSDRLQVITEKMVTATDKHADATANLAKVIGALPCSQVQAWDGQERRKV